ncbi:MAG: intradiol ring-cleavage dioxygenase [Micrococcus sp.]|nr:intradiol ring-cleavage dioxygenase [Micrococcus sp.]
MATPAPRQFEGRILHRQDEDIEDQGVAFDVGTLVSRRNALGVFGTGAGALLLAACGVTSGGSSASSASSSSSAAAATGSSSAVPSDLEEMPTETAGPYPGDGSNGPDVLAASGVERSDITTSIDSDTRAEGVPMTVTLRLIDLTAEQAPLAGAAVYLWQADAQGRYSMYSDGITDQTYLRGVQVAGEDGTVTFTSIVPGCYDGRWPHLHFEVFENKADMTDASNNVLTSQIALPEDMCAEVYATSAYSGSAANMAKTSLESDMVFADSYAQQLPEVSGSVSEGYTVSIDVGIDVTTAQQQSMGAPGRP